MYDTFLTIYFLFYFLLNFSRNVLFLNFLITCALPIFSIYTFQIYINIWYIFTLNEKNRILFFGL